MKLDAPVPPGNFGADEWYHTAWYTAWAITQSTLTVRASEMDDDTAAALATAAYPIIVEMVGKGRQAYNWKTDEPAATTAGKAAGDEALRRLGYEPA